MTPFSNRTALYVLFFPPGGGGGGRSLLRYILTVVFPVLLSFFLPASAFSQTGPSCNQWAIEVSESSLPYRTDIYGTPGCTDNCFRVYYHFYLVRVGAQSDLQTEQTFTFTNLTLIGTLGVTARNSSATGPGLSQVNVKESAACTTNFPGLNNPGNPSSPILNYSPSDHKFTYQVSSGTNQPVLSWSVYGRLPLFVLAVDVFPGETVEPSNLSFSFTLTDANGANPVVCDGVAASCTSPQNLAKTIAQPTNQCTSSMGIPFFRIGNAVDASAAGFPKRKKMPAHCAEVRLAAVHNSVTQSSNCGNVLYFDLFVSSTQNADLTDVRLALKIKKTGTFALSTAGTVSPYCSPGSCITVTDISADYLRVEYAVSSLSNLNLFANTPKLLATVALTTSDNGCISGIDFLDAVVFKTGATAACLPSWQSEFPENATADDICAVGHIFQVSAETESGTPIEAWNYYVDYHDDNFTNCLYHGLSPDRSTVSRCVCILQNTEQNVVLKKADNYLNGVSTYDLVLISKHIINVLPLSGFNMLAADANMSGSVTTFDVVELRKLILGIYSELPAANSWRFIDKDLKSTVQNSNNPFLIVHSTNQGGKTYSDIMDDIKYADEEFDEFSLPPTANLDSKAEFTGFKVGDVNNTALPSFTQQQTDDCAAGVLPLGTKNLEGRAGTMIEIPVFSLARQSLSGWQMALQFDTSVLQMTGVRWPANIPYGAMQDRGWHSAQPGELRLLWFDGKAASSFEAGTALFYVQARLRQDVRRAQQLLYLAPNGISPEAYDKELRQLRLDLVPSGQPLLSVPTALETAALSVYRLSVYPNPAGVHFRVEIEASAAAAARLEIRDVLEREVIRRSLDLAPGMNAVPDAQLPPLAQGQYIISLFTSAGVETIRLVKR